MKEKIEQILNEVKNFQAENKEALENFRITYLSKKRCHPRFVRRLQDRRPRASQGDGNAPQ